MAGGPFPRKHTALNGYFKTVTTYLNTHAARLSVSAPNLTSLNRLYNNNSSAPQSKLGWSQLWKFYSNPATVNKTIRAIVKTRRKQMQTKLRLIYRDIPASALTTKDRLTLKIPLRDTKPTLVQPVDFAPLLSFKKVSNGIQIVCIKNPKTPESNAMPTRQRAEVQQHVGEAGLPDNDVPFAVLQDTGRHLLLVNFMPAQKRQTAYYRARYKSPTGKVGPWSDVQSELVL